MNACDAKSSCEHRKYRAKGPCICKAVYAKCEAMRELPPGKFPRKHDEDAGDGSKD